MAAGQTSYAATGAAIGTQIMPGWGTAIGAVIGVVADIASKPADPSSAHGTFQNNLAFDNSGWNVAFGGATINSDSNSGTVQGGDQSKTSGIYENPYGAAGMGGGMNSADSLFGTSLGFDNSGWNVAYPGAKVTSKATKTLQQGGAQSSGPAMPAFMGSNFSYAVLALGAVVAIKWLKKRG